MALTAKGANALKLAQEFFPNSAFTAADLSGKSGEKIFAATLNGVVSNGYMDKLGGSPVQYQLVENLDVILALDAAQTVGCDNSNLITAKKVKNNEFYTRIEDVEKEVFQYRKQFRGKRVLLNCNDTENSAFWQYFIKNFDAFRLAQLTAISYNLDGCAEMLSISTDTGRNEKGLIDETLVQRIPLNGNGDFRSPESLDALDNHDIVVTNPPFSEFRDFIDILIAHGKQFLVIGSQNAFTYKEIFKLIKDNKIWPGHYAVHDFKTPSGAIQKFGNICWFTNMPTKVRNEPMTLTATYYKDTNKREDYPTYDDYDAINVSKVANIPGDFMGKMGVPITFINKYCPEQFEILGLDDDRVEWRGRGPDLNGKTLYRRVIIRRKSE